MANAYWKGGDGATDDSKGDFNLAANWQTAIGGAFGAVPGSADVMIFDSRAAVVPTTYSGTKHTIGNHYNCYYNMASGPDDCQGVIVAAEFTGLIGKTTLGVEAPLQLSLAAGKEMIIRGDSEAHFKIKTASKVVPKVIFDSTNGILVLSGVNDTNAVWTLIECYGTGTLELEDNTKYTDIVNYGAATIIVNETCPAGNITVLGGAGYCDSPVTNLKGSGSATFDLGQESLTNPLEDLDLADVEWYSSGIFTWRAAGKITAGDQYAGTISVVGPGAKQIGNSGNTITIHGGSFNASQQKGALTLGGTCALLHKPGGAVLLPDGTEITAFTTGN